jgi:hypothetical protein
VGASCGFPRRLPFTLSPNPIPAPHPSPPLRCGRRAQSPELSSPSPDIAPVSDRELSSPSPDIAPRPLRPGRRALLPELPVTDEE